jgi:hypothetical protein
LHPNLRPKKFWDKGKKIPLHHLDRIWDHLGDESRIMEIRRKYISIIKSNSLVQSAKLEIGIDQKKRSNIFHVRVIVNNTKIDTLFENGSQVNLVSEVIINNLGLKTNPHKTIIYIRLGV